MGRRTYHFGAIAAMLALACFTGCAPEEEASGVIVRPKANPSAAATAATQKSADTVTGGISTAGGLSSPTPQPAPPTLAPWTPAPPPSIAPIIIEPSATGSVPPAEAPPGTGGSETAPTVP